MNRSIGFLMVALSAICVQAKTVALWPMEKTSSGGFDAGCVIDSANDFVFDKNKITIVDQELGWELPPNPDTARHSKTPVNKSAVHSRAWNENFLYSHKAGDYLARDRAFTLEGWLKITSLPASNTWAIVAAAYDENTVSPHRWTLSFRRRPNEDYACTWILWGNGFSDTVLYNYGTEEASYAVTNDWMHVALVHEPVANGQGNWRLYFNGVLAGETTKGIPNGSPNAHRLSLGGRNSGNSLVAMFDYWRISDEALAPEGFLCAGGTGTPVPEPSPTVAYWPLDVTPSGGIDGRDAVGNAPLTSGFSGMTEFRQCLMGASESCAFAGNPPNATVTLTDGNAGSLQGSATSACLLQSSLGTELNVDRSFTVEGWFSPRICERDMKHNNEVVAYLFGTRPDYGRGWVLAYRTKGKNDFMFDVYCVDQLDGEDGLLQNSVKLSGSFEVKGWYETWRHLALVYDAAGGAGGFGRWSLYIDGELTGSVDNRRAVVPITSARSFFLGGRTNVENQSFQGGIDCVRVSKAALMPNQFLCATANAAAVPDADVLALWPLNAINGYSLDLRDVSGNDRHFMARHPNFNLQLVEGMPGTVPVITNPDRSPDFRGGSARVGGCAQFRNTGNGNRHRTYMETGNSEVMNAMARGKEFTFECYYRRLNQDTQDQEVLFVLANGISENSGSARTRIFRKNDGLYVWDAVHGNQTDYKIPGTSDSDLLAGVWYHIAIVHSVETVEGLEKRQTVWRVYVDGVLKGSTAVNLWDGNEVVQAIQIGGRSWVNNNSVNGCLSSVRLSNRALDPAEFLCAAATSPSPAPVKTEGYWPIDAEGTGLGNPVAEEYPLVAGGTAVAQALQAVPSILNAAALPELAASAARRNRGSYALGTGGELSAVGAGFAMSLRDSFTVEGWVKWTPSEGAQEADLVSAGNVNNDGGVRISLDRRGSVPRLRVKAAAVWPSTPFVDAAFDADLSMMVGEWTHVAVVYDSDDGTGSWTLFVDGKEQDGKVYNFYYPTSLDYFRSGTFRIGSENCPLEGSVDMWRLTCGVLPVGELLYGIPKGTVIFVR